MLKKVALENNLLKLDELILNGKYRKRSLTLDFF